MQVCNEFLPYLDKILAVGAVFGYKVIVTEFCCSRSSHTVDFNLENGAIYYNSNMIRNCYRRNGPVRAFIDACLANVEGLHYSGSRFSMTSGKHLLEGEGEIMPKKKKQKKQKMT